MNEKEWEKFFDLLTKIVNMDGMSANEKAELVRAKAEEFSCATDFSEFCGYCEDS